jgi:uncharacterized membrane protein
MPRNHAGHSYSALAMIDSSAALDTSVDVVTVTNTEGPQPHRRSFIQHLPIAGIVAGYVWYFTRLTLDVHRGLGSSAFDLGLYDQGVWLLSRFKTPFVTLMGRNLMGDHTSFILVLLVPLYWIAPGVGVLLFAQSALIGGGAFAVYATARKLIGGVWLPTLLGALYLAHPAVSWTNMENFHPDCFLGLFLPLALYSAICRRYRVFVVSAVLCMLVKEDVVLVMAPLAYWVAYKRKQRLGLVMLAGSFVYAVIATTVIMKALIGKPTLNAWRIPFGGPEGTLRTAVQSPSKMAAYLRADHRPWYVWQMLGPYLPAFLFAPDIALISSLVLFTNVISTFFYQHSVRYHYSLILVPSLMMASVVGISKLQGRKRHVIVAITTIVAITSGYLWTILPGSRNLYAHSKAANPIANEVRSLAKRIPPNAVVSATHSFAPQIDHRERIYMFPTPFAASTWGLYDREGKRLPFADEIEYVFISPDLEDHQTDWDKVKGGFTLIVEGHYSALYVRNDLAPSP